MAKKAKAEAEAKLGPIRSWEIQYAPRGALPALILRYLSPKKAITFNRLFQMVWDDLVECVFWTTERVDNARAKVFVHGLGSAYADDRRRTIKDDMKAALTALAEGPVIVTGRAANLLVSYEARAAWLAQQPTNVFVLYNSLRMTHDGWEGARVGLEQFNADGSLKDPRDEEIRQLKLERDRLKIDLDEARGLLKLRADASARRRVCGGS